MFRRANRILWGLASYPYESSANRKRMPPAMTGRYEIVSELERGGVAVVHLTRDPPTNDR